MKRFIFVSAILIQLTVSAFCFSQQPIPMQVEIDASDISRRLIEAKLRIPVDAKAAPRQIALWYPKWVPGSHGPGGPIANIAGMRITDPSGRVMQWKRTPGEVYRLTADVPGGTSELEISLRYITNQPTTNSMGHDCFGSTTIGLISPSCLILYPEQTNIDQQEIRTTLILPEGWKAASALTRVDSSTAPTNSPTYKSVNLRTFADSPIMCGKFYREFTLAEDSELCPHHSLHVFADDEIGAELNQEVLEKYQAMVLQTALLVGSHPFDRFDILLGITNSLPKNGLEHARSTMNVLPPGSLRSPQSLKGWDRLLVPHEYLHAWCGKYRRPAGMLKSDFHQPKDTELLWVYEGLTQYLGELIEARCGLMSKAEFRHRLFVELRSATLQQGRQWRTLADTAAASHILRSGSSSWGGLRRSQDYYMEGMLFWIEADAQIRKLTEGEKSLDDFCHRFFVAPRSAILPRPFDRAEIIETLNSIAEFDWDGLISRRIESFQQNFDPSFATLLGYNFQLGDTKPQVPASTFRYSSGIDFLDSIGLSVSSSGTVQRVLLGGPADAIRLAPGTKIIGVNGRTFSSKHLQQAIKQASDSHPIELLLDIDEELQTRSIPYGAGLRYWNLIRDRSTPDILSEILNPLTVPQAASAQRQ